MRKSVLQLYAPFIALAVVQALLVVSAPSRGPNRTASAGGASVAGGSAAPTGAGASAAALPGSSTAVPGATNAGSAGSAGATPSGGAATGTPGAAGGTSAGAGSVAPGAAVAAGDTSRNNGGATYQGVTATSIKVVNFFSAANEQVNAILAPQGLAQTKDQTTAYDAAAKQFVEKHYELYGRKIDMVEYFSTCPTTPPDIPTCKEEARKVIAMHPFMVVWAQGLYSSIFDDFARAGIVTLGGWHFDANNFTTRRPYRYDVLMDGTDPAGGRWNFDAENREPPPKQATLGVPEPWWPVEDEIDEQVRHDLDRWERDGDVSFIGVDGPRRFAATRTEALPPQGSGNER